MYPTNPEAIEHIIDSVTQCHCHNPSPMVKPMGGTFTVLCTRCGKNLLRRFPTKESVALYETSASQSNVSEKPFPESLAT
jgi:hypothetical protein